MSVLIVDGNNLGYRIYSSFMEKGGALTNTVGKPTTVVFGFLRALETFVKTHKVEKTIVCWDLGGGSAYRKGLFKHYKANRVYKDMKPYFEELDACREYFKVLGIPQAPCSGIEADDVVAWFTTNEMADGKVIVFSDDKDYYQLLAHTVSIWRPCVEKMYGLSDFFKEYDKWLGFKPRHLAKLDALIGRGKDNIPGACDLDKNGVMQKYGFGEAKAAALLVAGGYRLGNIYAFLRGIEEPAATSAGWPTLNPRFVDQLLKNWGQVRVSQKMAMLRTDNAQYGNDELTMLQAVWKDCHADRTVRRKNVIKLMDDLEIRTINVLPILQNIGVQLDGKATKTAIRFKT